jgi:hypothetical protein
MIGPFTAHLRNIAVKQETRAWIVKLAKQRELSMSHVIREALELYRQVHKQELA